MKLLSPERPMPAVLAWLSVLLLYSLAGADGIPAPDQQALDRGRFVHEGRALSWFCTGSGAPTLILEAPSGVSAEAAFQNVLPELASRARVCAYERAAYGGSDPLPPGMIQTVSDYAAELGTFMGHEAVQPPFVLIGFSYGGFVSRYYAGHHPDRVLGMVLIDSPHVRWLREMKARLSAEDWGKVEEIMAWFIENRGHDVWRSQFEVEQAPALARDLPLVVITRGQDHERMRLSGISEAGFRIYNDVHFELAPELLELTERSVALTAPDSDHIIPDAEPEVVVEAVDRVLSMIDPEP